MPDCNFKPGDIAFLNVPYFDIEPNELIYITGENSEFVWGRTMLLTGEYSKSGYFFSKDNVGDRMYVEIALTKVLSATDSL